MTDQGLKRANEIKEEIAILKTEIKSMESNWNTFKTPLFRFKKRHSKPKNKTVNSYWETDRTLDSIGSVIVLTPDEVDLVKEYKENKIEKLETEFESLV